MKTISILGSTGSVGRSTVDLACSQPESFSVQALTAHKNVDLLVEQAKTLRARRAVIADNALYADLKDRLAGTGIEAAAGPQAIIEAATMPADWIMAAIVGVAGLDSVMAAIAQGKCVAIANKEPLVAAGPFVTAAAQRSGATLLPVDSEHNAVFQVWNEEQRKQIEKIILTASGGPFRSWSRDQMAAATPAQAVAHPNWAMGAKISVDSATMMNKALELIEAHYLFDLTPGQIEIVVHPQSLVHAMVVYSDGSVLTQMGAPDMRTPIAHTLAWPQRMATTGARLDLRRSLTLDFYPPDFSRFPAPLLAYEALNQGLWACVALNAANEVAVTAFLEGQIPFLQVVETSSKILESQSAAVLSDISDVKALDKEVRARTLSLIMSADRRKARS